MFLLVKCNACDGFEKVCISVFYCVGNKGTVVKGLVPLKTHQISVIAVYKDGTEERGHTEYLHSGMSRLILRSGICTLHLPISTQLALHPHLYLPVRLSSVQLYIGSLMKDWRLI